METFLVYMGINPQDLFAGFVGGLIAALVTSGPRPTVWAIFSAITVGAGAGAYVGPMAPLYLGMKPSAFASFVVGLGGMPICRMLIKGVSAIRWSPGDAKIKSGE